MKKADRKKERFRNEWKYLISTSEKEVLNLRMKPLMKLDPHAENGGYLIRSLYFDDYWNSAYEEKESGVLMRKKYRIRIYNYSAESIKLERKKKFGSYIYKEDAPLTKDEVQKILSGEYEFLLKSPYNLCREFYIECMSNMMRPRTIVDYEREPWIMDEGTVRITFDTDVRAAVGSYDIFDSTLPALSVLEPGKLIMEVKFTEMLPHIVISLGMVGALSIVRFRTAIKDPMDLLYLFWAITSGITAGAGMYALTLLTAVIIILMITLFYHKQQNGRIYIAVIHYQGTQAGDEIIRCFGKRKYFVKSKTMRNEKTEMAVEIYCRQNDMEFMEKIRDIGGVEDVTLIQYNGEYHG